ncbi:ROK family protein [Myxococcota bacterium]|nr:ROK family protein [Myxococcota bacterium]
MEPHEWLLGIDLGGTKTAVALAGRNAEIRARRRFPTPRSGDPRRDFEFIAERVRELLEQSECDPTAVTCLGVSVPGPLDAEMGSLLHPPNLPGWEKVPLRSWLEQEFGRPVEMENDANAGAMAEWRFGAGRGARDLVFLTLSTGVGAGLILDGRLHRGVSGNAGEFGHTVLVPDGLECACGLNGCVEAYLGGRAWSTRLRSETPGSSRVFDLAGDRSRISPEHLVEAARWGDEFALDEMARYNANLVGALVNVAFAYAPEVIVLGTIPSAAGEELCVGPVRQGVEERIWPELARGLAIRASELGDRGADLAAICVALQSLEGD